jgi:hypothetical protein
MSKPTEAPRYQVVFKSGHRVRDTRQGGFVGSVYAYLSEAENAAHWLNLQDRNTKDKDR